MKTIGELIHSLDLEDVIEALKENYQGPGEDEDGYREMWEKLQVMKPKKTTLTCYISKKGYFDTKEEYFDVSGMQPNDDQHYAIEFVSWAEWLSMPIKLAENIKDISEAEQLAHCLCEMTAAGYDQEDIQDQLNYINTCVDEAKAQYEKEYGPSDPKKLN